MRVVHDSRLEIGYRVWQLRPPTPSLTVVVKGTFDYGDGRATLAAEQVPTTGERWWEDDLEQSVRTPSDFALLKPRGECMVIGHAFAPGARPTPALTASFRVGALQKDIAVFGDRRWEGSLVKRIGAPELFTSMPLRLERAFGGPGTENPFGLGRGESERLPNLESPGALVDSPRATRAPLVTGPIPASWPLRARHVGTYDAAWQRERWPWLPKDFGWEYFLEAPSDQRLASGFFRGDEPIELRNLARDRPHVRTALPGLVPRVALEPTTSSALREVPMSLDTVVIDTDLAKILLVWRGIVEITSERLDDVRHLFVTVDALERTRSREVLAAHFRALLAAEDAGEVDLEGVEPPAVNAPDDAPEPLADGPPDEDAAQREALAAFEAEQAARLAELHAAMAALDVSPEQADTSSAPPDPAAMLASLRASGVEVDPELEALLSAPAPEAEAETETQHGDEPDDEAPELTPRQRVRAALRDGTSLVGADLAGGDLSGLDLRGVDLSEAVLSDCSLHESDLSGAVLRGATLTGAELVAARLTEADLSGADLSGANARQAVLAKAKLVEATLNGCRLAGADLSGADLSRASLLDADLTEVRASGALFVEADLDRATLDGADLSSADLREASLEDARAERARFSRATLKGLRAEGLKASDARFDAVRADDSFWERAELTRCDFSFSELTRAELGEATLREANLDGCRLRQARFEHADLERASLRGADLFEATFEGARLGSASLKAACLYGAELWRADLTKADLALANLERTKRA